MELSLRLPYDVKAMKVRYTTLDGAPFTPPYGDIHHRTETLRGLSDPSLDLDVAAGDQWTLALGTTLPAGHIVPDPIVLGREGKTHEHIQFGRVTIDPRLNGQFQTLGRWSGVVDEGTGFRNGGARLQVSMPLGSMVVAPSVYRELWTHGSADQTFRQRTTWALSLSRVY